MDIGFSLPDFQKALQTRFDTSRTSYNLQRLAPSLASNKAAQQANIYANLEAKAFQLHDLLTGDAGNQFSSPLINARDALADIEDRGLIAVLQSHVRIDIGGLGESLRGKSVDTKN